MLIELKQKWATGLKKDKLSKLFYNIYIKGIKIEDWRIKDKRQAIKDKRNDKKVKNAAKKEKTIQSFQERQNNNPNQ